MRPISSKDGRLFNVVPNSSFPPLEMLCRSLHGVNPGAKLVSDWAERRKMYMFERSVIPAIVQRCIENKGSPSDVNPDITLSDSGPGYALSANIEYLCNILYSMSEIAAFVIHLMSNKNLPISFSGLVKKRSYHDALDAALGDLSAYDKVHEIRTELCHFSTLFVNTLGRPPELVLRSYRPKAKHKMHYKELELFSVEDYLQWAGSAFGAIDRLADFILSEYVFPVIDLDNVVSMPLYDKHGMLVMENKLLKMEKISMREHLHKNCGIIAPQA